MRPDSKSKIDRRDLLRVLGAGAGAVATPVALVAEAHADSESNETKRKARYDANSEDVKAFYRVNEYPKSGWYPCSSKSQSVKRAAALSQASSLVTRPSIAGLFCGARESAPAASLFLAQCRSGPFAKRKPLLPV